MRARLVAATRHGRRLTTAAGLILVVSGVWQLGLAVAYGRHLLHIARGGFVATIGTSWPALDLLAATLLAAAAWLLVGIAVSSRSRWFWTGLPAALLLATVSVRWQARDSGLRPITAGLSLDGSDSAEIIVAAGALLAVGIAAFSAVVLASGLVLGRWRAIALGALLLGAVAFALMQALPRDDLTPAIAAATAALSLGEPVTTVVLGVVLIAGVRSSRQTGPSSARRIVPVEVLS